MTKINTGGPMTPQFAMDDWQPGMTMRDAFAMNAMAAMIAKAPFFDREGEHGNPIDLEQFRADIAVSAVEYADALIAALGEDQ